MLSKERGLYWKDPFYPDEEEEEEEKDNNNSNNYFFNEKKIKLRMKKKMMNNIKNIILIINYVLKYLFYIKKENFKLFNFFINIFSNE